MSRRSESRNSKIRVFAHGFPGRYGGASTELHHQIKLWLAMGMEVHIIPSQVNYQNEPLYTELVQSGVIIHGCNQWESITEEDAVLGFCNAEFLTHLPENGVSGKTVSVWNGTGLRRPSGKTSL
jgi:hypothetical protein